MLLDDGFDRQTVAWYARPVEAGELSASPVIRLVFEGAFREARVWLGGVELGRFDLPYLPFSFDVSEALGAAGGDLLVVRVDNRQTRQTLPCDTTMNPGRHGWFPYGGLTRRVYLEGSRATSIQRVDTSWMVEDGGGARLDATVLLHRAAADVGSIELEAWLTRAVAPEERVASAGPFLVGDDQAAGSLSLTLAVVQRWSPENPDARYRLHLRLRDGGGALEAVALDVACKTFEAADQRLWLNGEDRFLRAINRHEDHPTLGPVYEAAAVAVDVALMTELGVDFCRPGHYPNDVRVLQQLERAGIMLVEEAPVYQLDGPQMEDPVLTDLAVGAVQRMVVRDRNRPGIVMWSVANEVWSFAPEAEPFIRTLADAARALDPSRPVMMAHVAAGPLSLSEQDDGAASLDVVGINQYWGWYQRQSPSFVTDLEDYLDRARARYPDKALFVSEYGAGAELGRHLGPGEAPGEEPLDAHSYTEEFQRWFHEQHLAVFASRPFIRGVMPWVLADFRMQWTPATGDPHPIERMNLKGLVSMERERKLAFDTLEAFYSEH